MTDFRITGTGEFKTRDGRRAVIIGKREDCTACWVGYIVNGSVWAWTDHGIALPYPNFPSDILSKWEEPEIIEGWVNIHPRYISGTYKTKGCHPSLGIIACRKIRWDGTKIIDVTENPL